MKTQATITALALALASSTMAAEPDIARFYPSMIDTLNSKPVKSDMFQSSLKCKDCHPTQYNQWRDSIHAHSFKDPFYRAMLPDAVREGGEAMTHLCAGCHTPVGTVSEFVWFRQNGEVVSSDMVDEGVTCDICHSTAALRMLNKNGIPGNAGLVIDLSGTKYGPYGGEITDLHPIKYSEVHTKSIICGVCHNIYHPVTNTLIARTYEEWKETVYSEHKIQCQDCHMVPPQMVIPVADNLKKVEIPGETSAWETIRTPFYPHNFSGSNAALAKKLGLDNTFDEARALLDLAASVAVKNAALNAAQKEISFEVEVKNERAGHNLPTGMTEIRQMWLNVEVKDLGDSGKVVWESGDLQKDGSLAEGTVIFGSKAVDVEGKPTSKPWKVAKIVEDTTIPARTSVKKPFTAALGDAKGPFEVVARLKYRSADQKFYDSYMKEGAIQLPVITMAQFHAEVR